MCIKRGIYHHGDAAGGCLWDAFLGVSCFWVFLVQEDCICDGLCAKWKRVENITHLIEY